ncbi:unnamed protein product [Cylindrotheca closterium]|uniref:J domain-containing protein n=1 Tax=Cylindrotheca closterium TaxID=2856 RepID=A0AAD2GE48_9STRA|nr:unnamed protein product [Cylindrotheca closterium]
MTNPATISRTSSHTMRRVVGAKGNVVRVFSPASSTAPDSSSSSPSSSLAYNRLESRRSYRTVATASSPSSAFPKKTNFITQPKPQPQPQNRQLHFTKQPPSNSNNNADTTKRSFSSASKRDFYEVLGVSKSSNKAEIKKAYFGLAKKYHPDTNKDDEAASDKFKEVTEAYECLSDDEQRGLYDQFGHAGVDPNFQGGNPFGGGGGRNPFEGGFNFGDGSFHFSGGSGGGGQIDPEELFDAFFGGGARRARGPRRGADLQMHVRLSFEEAAFGSSQDLHLRYQVLNQQNGQIEVKERDVTVDTPAGIDTGMNLRVTGQGAEGDPGAPRGNLLVQVLVDDHDYFHREGSDVHVEAPISISQAILGGTVDVRTLGGEVEVTVPKGTQPETKLVLRNKGIQRMHGAGKGNQYVHLKIEIPKSITKRQEELLREFDEETKETGKGISGRLAEAAGSAFESFFGGGSSSSKSKDSNKDKKEDEEELEDKKQAAQ